MGSDATRGGGILDTNSVTFGPTGCSTARSDGTHSGGVEGSFGCLGRGFALGGSRGDGVWVSSEELSARRTARSTPRLLLSSSGVGGSVFWVKTLVVVLLFPLPFGCGPQ